MCFYNLFFWGVMISCSCVECPTLPAMMGRPPRQLFQLNSHFNVCVFITNKTIMSLGCYYHAAIIMSRLTPHTSVNKVHLASTVYSMYHTQYSMYHTQYSMYHTQYSMYYT